MVTAKSPNQSILVCPLTAHFSLKIDTLILGDREDQSLLVERNTPSWFDVLVSHQLRQVVDGESSLVGLLHCSSCQLVLGI